MVEDDDLSTARKLLEKAEMRDSYLADFEEEISKLLNTDNEYEQELNLKRSKLAVKPARPVWRCWQRLRRTK